MAEKCGIQATEAEATAHMKIKEKFLDALLHNLKSRLAEPALVSHLAALDLTNVQRDARTLHGFEEIQQLADHIRLDPDELIDEWIRLKDLVMEEGCCPDLTIPSIAKFLVKTPSITQVFKGLNILYGVASTVPISTAEVERLFSAIKLLYTDHRARLHVQTADHLLMIKLNGPSLDTNKFPYLQAAKKWRNGKKHRL